MGASGARTEGTKLIVGQPRVSDGMQVAISKSARRTSSIKTYGLGTFECRRIAHINMHTVLFKYSFNLFRRKHSGTHYIEQWTANQSEKISLTNRTTSLKELAYGVRYLLERKLFILLPRFLSLAILCFDQQQSIAAFI